MKNNTMIELSYDELLRDAQLRERIAQVDYTKLFTSVLRTIEFPLSEPLNIHSYSLTRRFHKSINRFEFTLMYLYGTNPAVRGAGKFTIQLSHFFDEPKWYEALEYNIRHLIYKLYAFHVKPSRTF